jgi:DNA-binding GntR family transcriptional regulator
LDVRAARNAQSVTAAMHELAVREALSNLTGTELEAMREANSRFAAALRRDDVDAAITADDDFHGVLVTASANDALRDVLEQFTPVLRRLERLRFASLSGRTSVAQHDRIISLCESGDVDAAAVANRANWEMLAHLLDDHDPAGGGDTGSASAPSRR